jgi:peptide-methionine (R)-S-oxide reductase
MDMSWVRRDGARLVAYARVGVGVSMLVRPALLPRTVGVDRVTAERLSWLTRMAGVREVVLGVGTARALRHGSGSGSASGAGSGAGSSAPSGEARAWVLGSAACDAVDALVFAGAAARGRVHPALGWAVASVAVASTATNVAGLSAAP